MDGSRALAAVEIPPWQIHIEIDVADPLLGRLVWAADTGWFMGWALVVVGVLVQQAWAFRWLVAATATVGKPFTQHDFVLRRTANDS